MKRLRDEFTRFIRSYGIIGIAIGIVMGNAVAKLINTIVNGLVMPVWEVLLPQGQKWEDAVIHLGKINIKIGLIIAATIDFFIIALVVFFFVRYILRIEDK